MAMLEGRGHCCPSRGVFFEARSYLWKLDRTGRAVEWVSSKKKHIMRDMNGILGVILTFGGNRYKPPCAPVSPPAASGDD